MDLGKFSVSLAVKDIGVSRAFYEKLGFAAIAGEQGQGWLIMQSASATVGLFQGMFEKNILTFNPGWDDNGVEKTDFADIRVIQKELKARGVPLVSEYDETGAGPASCTIIDPDGNPILIDQHV